MACNNKFHAANDVVLENGGGCVNSVRPYIFNANPVGKVVINQGKVVRVVAHLVGVWQGSTMPWNALVIENLDGSVGTMTPEQKKNHTVVDGNLPANFDVIVDNNRNSFPCGLETTKYSKITPEVEMVEWLHGHILRVTTPKGNITLSGVDLYSLEETVDYSMPKDFEPDEGYTIQDAYEKSAYMGYAVLPGKGEYPYAIILRDSGDSSVGIQGITVCLTPDRLMAEAQKGDMFVFDGEDNKEQVINYNLIKDSAFNNLRHKNRR